MSILLLLKIPCDSHTMDPTLKSILHPHQCVSVVHVCRTTLHVRKALNIMCLSVVLPFILKPNWPLVYPHLSTHPLSIFPRPSLIYIAPFWPAISIAPSLLHVKFFKIKSNILVQLSR